MPDLGKYGAEVLSAYGATIVLLVALIWQTWARSRRVKLALKAAEARHSNG
ncbi:MAG: heme exporter protein CcmD [Paracoccaceae bacterium]